jgi:hypothetical protein
MTRVHATLYILREMKRLEDSGTPNELYKEAVPKIMEDDVRQGLRTRRGPGRRLGYLVMLTYNLQRSILNQEHRQALKHDESLSGTLRLRTNGKPAENY